MRILYLSHCNGFVPHQIGAKLQRLGGQNPDKIRELVQSTPQTSHLEWYLMFDNSVRPLRVLSSKDRNVVCTRRSNCGLSGRFSQCHVCPTPVYLMPLFPTAYTAAFTFQYPFCCLVATLFLPFFFLSHGTFLCLTEPWKHFFKIYIHYTHLTFASITSKISERFRPSLGMHDLKSPDSKKISSEFPHGLLTIFFSLSVPSFIIE